MNSDRVSSFNEDASYDRILPFNLKYKRRIIM